MNENDKVSDLVRQNHNSRKLTSEAVEALTGKPLEWFLEAIGNRNEVKEDGNELNQDAHDNKNSKEGAHMEPEKK